MSFSKTMVYIGSAVIVIAFALCFPFLLFPEKQCNVSASVTREVVEDYGLKGSANDSQISSSFSGGGNLLYAQVSGSSEEEQVLRYYRVSTDEAGREYSTFTTENMSNIRLYEDDSQKPAERRHYTVTERCGRQVGKELNYVEIVIPAGTLETDHSISLSK